MSKNRWVNPKRCNFVLFSLLDCCCRRQRGLVVRASDLKSGDPELKSRSDHQLDLFQVVMFRKHRARQFQKIELQL